MLKGKQNIQQNLFNVVSAGITSFTNVLYTITFIKFDLGARLGNPLSYDQIRVQADPPKDCAVP